MRNLDEATAREPPLPRPYAFFTSNPILMDSLPSYLRRATYVKGRKKVCARAKRRREGSDGVEIDAAILGTDKSRPISLFLQWPPLMQEGARWRELA